MILAIDLGSTGIRSIVVNHEGKIVAYAYRRIGQFYPRIGWSEHDLDDIWAQCLAVCCDVLKSGCCETHSIKGIGLTTQRNTLAIWDRFSGKPLLPAISWSDNRAKDLCQIYSERDKTNRFLKRSGRRLLPSNIGLRLLWAMENDVKLKKKFLSKAALWGTLDTWLLWKLSSAGIWATDYSNAGCSGIFDLLNNAWSEELMEFLDLPGIAMPEVRPTTSNYGETAKEVLGHPIPIFCVSGDQYASLFGQGCVHPGMAKCTLGTGGFFIVNIGTRPVQNIDEIITRLCWHLGDRPIYGLEGAIFHVGTLLEWLCNKLRLVDGVEQSAKMAAEAESRGLYIVPAFSGLGSPFWDSSAKAILVGASLDTGPAELIRAGLEAVAFRIQDIVETMKKSVSMHSFKFRFDGNVSMNSTLMQIVADQLQCEVERSSSFEYRSALGAAFLAGLHAGIWQDIDEIATMWSPGRVFYPQKDASETRELYNGWLDAVMRSRGRFIS